MKKKILLLISLVLLAVQGWATPADSLNTHLTRSGFSKWNGVNLTDISSFSNGLEQKKKPDVLNDDYIPWPLNIVIASIDIAPTNDVSFFNVPVGASVTKEFELSSDNIYQVAENYRKIHNLAYFAAARLGDSVTIPYAASVKIKVKISPTNAIPGDNIIDGITADRDSLYKKVFSLDNDLIDHWEFRNGKSKIINLTFRPSVAIQYRYEFVFSYVFLDMEGNDITSIVEIAPIVQACGLSSDLATAVDATITTDKSHISFMNAPVGQTQTEHLTVTGKNLIGPLTLTCSGDDQDKFWLYPDHITAEDAEKDVDVTVKYVSLETGNHNATLTISGGGAESVSVGLTGSCVANQSITISPSTWDFGTVNVESTNTKTFTVTGTNLSERISMVNQLETTGCEYTVSPESLPASGGTVTVTYKPTNEGSSGAVFTYGSGSVSAKITVEGKSVIPPTIKPSATSLNFGIVAKGKNAHKTLTVTGINLTGDLTLSSNRPYFTVSPSTITAAEAKVGKTVTVTYTPTAGGDHSATLTISGGDAESKPVDLTGKCAAIDVTPSSTHNFGTVKAGTTNTTTFTVKGTNLSERIVLTWPQENGFTITPTDLPASGGKVTVTFKPTAAGSYSQEINLSSSGVSNKITVTGKCATITTSVSSLDFGTVVKDKETSRSFWVKGAYLTGNLTLSSSSSYFKVSPTTITAAEAATGKTVTVTYNPTVKGTHNATITISGGNAATKLVNMTGKSVVPVITTSTSSLNFTGKESKQFKVTGTDLTGNLSLYITGSGSQYFTLSKSSITASAAAGGVTVSVLCNAPSSLSSATAKVVIYGGDAASRSVDLNYNQNQPLAINSVQPGGEGGNGDENGNEKFTNGGLQEMMSGLATSVNEMSMKDVKIFAEGLNIIIESPVEQRAVISDIAGRARSVNLQLGRNEIPVNASGIYIVRIREKTTKLMIK